MILLDALYVNSGGAKILLDYLVKEIEKNNLEVFYLFDERCNESYHEISCDRKIYLKSSFFERYKFYLNNKYRFKKALCFGNLPPNIKLRAKVFTYFHQPMYLNIPKDFSFKDRIKFKLKIKVLKLIAKNTDYWITQSHLIKEKLHQKFHFKNENIKILPFYPQFGNFEEQVRERFTYLYVSTASPHKNHSRLLKAFCHFYDKYNLGKLIVTVEEEYQSINNMIKEKQKLGYPIKNIGFVGRDELQKNYLSSEFLIFPSLTESFGLGLIEAIECGCKVIGADLPYTYEVCEPSIVFNPLDDESFLKAFENSLNEDVKNSIPRIKNNIYELINILKENQCN
ncbi:MAG: glycosyltransferase [Flavobacteriaceae bacterium]